MKWTEDKRAIFSATIILLLALLAFLILPLTGIGENNNLAASFLKSMNVKTAKWEINPFLAFTTSSTNDQGIEHMAIAWKTIFGFISGIIFLILVFLLSHKDETDGKKSDFLKASLLVFCLAMISYIFASQANLKDAGFGYPLWAIALGVFINNVWGLPSWAETGLKHELFIKTGLVLLGAEILFGKIVAIGIPGIFVAWVVTPIVLVATFWFGQRILKIKSKSLNVTISADMSVCGVSAAIATAAASKATKEELTTAVGLSMVFTSIMMVAMPAFIKWVGMPEVLGGAWLGGTLDATGAVVAAGAFLGEKAMSVAATIKMIQNILIGVIAFGVAYYWSTKVEVSENADQKNKANFSEIWLRLPKFILGFVAASIMFSILHAGIGSENAKNLLEDGVLKFTGHMREFLFCLAFVSIGLSTNFKVLKQQFSGGKPLILYVVGQSFNLILTLLMAWLMFYKLFPEITAGIQ